MPTSRHDELFDRAASHQHIDISPQDVFVWPHAEQCGFQGIWLVEERGPCVFGIIDNAFQTVTLAVGVAVAQAGLHPWHGAVCSVSPGQ
eukprot:Transcript_32485.p4 GENE.Transcript_32485~~Transcript_32485.p4  ORF type:complete len:89 (-),score=1.46 Transcript_32485:918-1184(-)